METQHTEIAQYFILHGYKPDENSHLNFFKKDFEKTSVILQLNVSFNLDVEDLSPEYVVTVYNKDRYIKTTSPEYQLLTSISSTSINEICNFVCTVDDLSKYYL